MKHDGEKLSRRELLVRGGWLTLAAGDRLFVCALGNTAQIPTHLDSLGDVTEIAREVQIWREK